MTQPLSLAQNSQWLKAVADETRLLLLCLIASESELCVCELTGATELSQPKVSRHLSVLRDQGLLNTRKVEQWVYYRIAEGLPNWLVDLINQQVLANHSALQPFVKQLTQQGPAQSRRLRWCKST